MKCDIEVVGERCRRKNEPRPTYVHDVTASARAQRGPDQRPLSLSKTSGEKIQGKLQGGKVIRAGHARSLSSWRRSTFHGREGAGSGGLLDDSDIISQEQMGMKVKISYVDTKGQVHPTPKSFRPGRSHTLVDLHMGSEDPALCGVDARGMSPWGSAVSVAHLPNRLYRPKSMVSARDRILSSLLDKHFVSHQGDFQSQSPETGAEEELFNGQFTTSSIPTSLPWLTTPTAGTSPPSSLLPKEPSPEGCRSAAAMRTESSSSPSNTPRSPTSNPSTVSWVTVQPVPNGVHLDGKPLTTAALTNGHRANGTGPTMSSTTTNRSPPYESEFVHRKEPLITAVMNKTQMGGTSPSVMNGIHAHGKGPTSSDVMNGMCANGKDPTEFESTTKRDGAHESPHGKFRRSATCLSGKRSHARASAMMKDHIRNMYLYRRVQSAGGGGGGGGGWQGPSGSVAKAYGRLRNRSKTVVTPTVEVPRDENAPPTVSRMFRKFRMVASIALTLIRLKAAIVVNSLDRTERSAAEIQWRTLYGEQEAEKLAFSKSYYSRERITTKMPRWALEIFEVAPEDRTEQDCRRLHALFRGMRSFDKFTEEIQLNLCRSFSYACVGECRIILRRGHIGHNFYFIYSGSVFVNVPDLDSEGELFIKTEAVLARGDSFGELALLKDIRRTATVSVRETCELLVVDKDVFGQVCPKIFEKELMEKKTFISRMSLFSAKWWSADALSSLCMEAQIQEYKINKIVVENNTTEEWLYICMEGQCQVIRCLSEDGEREEEEEKEEERKRQKRRRESSIILSDDIIELLASTRKAKVGEDEDDEEEDEGNGKGSGKEKLLYSLGLEYVDTGKRSGAFLEEVEEEERRKAFLASTGPMTLTSLIAQKRKEGKKGLVYVKVGTLESEDVFDIVSLVKPPAPRTHSALLLVSCGARMLRLKKSLFLKLASPQALEHTRAVVSKNPFPSETAIIESYKTKVSWNAYKAEVVKDVVRSRELRSAPLYRGDKKKETPRSDPAHMERSRTIIKAQLPAPSSPGKIVDAKSAVTFEEDRVTADNGQSVDSADSLPVNGVEHSDRQPASEPSVCKEESDAAVSHSEDDEDEVHGLNTESTTSQHTRPARIFPIVEVDTTVDPDTPRLDSSELTENEQKTGQRQPVELERDVGPGPEAVIVRRKSSVGSNSRPSIAVDTTFVTRRRRSRAETSSSGHVTRFNLADDLDSDTVVENT